MTRSSDNRFFVKLAVIAAAVLLLTVSALFAYGSRAGLDFPDYNVVFRSFGLSPQSVAAESFIEFASVGNADCIIIFSKGHAAMIDAGDNTDSGHAVEKHLLAAGIRIIDSVIVTHYHDDHIGGMPRILKAFSVGQIALPPLETNDEQAGAVSEMEAAIVDSNVKTVPLTAGDSFTVGDFTLTVLCVYSDEPDENDRSAVVMAECGGKRFLLTGDAGKAAEERLIESGVDLKADVLKLGHHGSATATTDAFLNAVSPEIAVISCGATRSSTPADSVIRKLKRTGISVIRTDISGTVRLTISEGGISIETGR